MLCVLKACLLCTVIAGDSSDGESIGDSLSIGTELWVAARLRELAAYTHFDAGPVVTLGRGHDSACFLVGVEWSI